MTISSSPECKHSQENDRRRYRRFLAQPVDIALQADGQRLEGKLVNESIGGLAVSVHGANHLVVGQMVQISLRDAVAPAYVRSVHRSLDGKCRVSVSWEKSPSREANAIAEYLAHDNLFLVCEIVRSDDNHLRLVRLWDGAEFEVFEDDLHERSYEERRDELNTVPTKLPTLARLYGLKPKADPNAIVADILAFEFSSKFEVARHRS